MNIKRHHKRYRLIKRLWRYYCNLFNDGDVFPLRFVIKDYSGLAYSKMFDEINKRYYGKPRIVKINLNQVYTDLFRLGLGDDYYEGRDEATKIIKSSKKLALRFTLLHELHHAIMSKSLGHLDKGLFLGRDYERQADEFARAYCMV